MAKTLNSSELKMKEWHNFCVIPLLKLSYAHPALHREGFFVIYNKYYAHLPDIEVSSTAFRKE